MGTRLALCALAIAAFVVVLSAGHAVAADPTEPELKAEFVERFTRFVDWAQLPEKLSICVVGDSPITPYLEKVARRQLIKGKQARVMKAPAENVGDCQIVLIAGDDHDDDDHDDDDNKRLRAVLDRTAGRPILTIAEAPGAAAAGAIINLYLDDVHIKFEINVSAAKNSGLTLRSKLLRLARIVNGGKAAP